MLKRSAIDRFNERIQVQEDGCWLWPGGKSTYGQFTDDDGRLMTAHRWAYEHFIGPVPDGLQIDHTCRRTRCVRFHHLEAVTHAENQRRRAAAITACPQGHEYTPENTYLSRTNKRSCIACRRTSVRAWQGREQIKAQDAGFVPWAKRTHCKRNHEFTPENTLVRTRRRAAHGGGRGGQYRECRTCIRARLVDKRGDSAA